MPTFKCLNGYVTHTRKPQLCRKEFEAANSQNVSDTATTAKKKKSGVYKISNYTCRLWGFLFRQTRPYSKIKIGPLQHFSLVKGQVCKEKQGKALLYSGPHSPLSLVLVIYVFWNFPIITKVNRSPAGIS